MTQVVPVSNGRILHSLSWSGDPEPMAVTYGVAPRLTSTLTPQEIVDNAAQAFIDNFLTHVSSLISLVQTELFWQATAMPDPPEIFVSTLVDTGAEAGTVIPQNSAYLVHKRSAVGGRGNRGRLYVPGVREAAVDNLGNVDGGTLSSWNTALAAFLTQIIDGGDGFDMVIFHDSAAATAGDPPATVTVMTLDPVIATQRRRLRR